MQYQYRGNFDEERQVDIFDNRLNFKDYCIEKCLSDFFGQAKG